MNVRVPVDDFTIEKPTAEFSERAMEAAFRAETLSDWQRANALLVAAGSIVFFLFSISDYFIVGWRMEFVATSATRCILLVAGMVLVRILIKSRKPAECDRATFIFYLLFPLALAVIMSVRIDGQPIYSEANFAGSAVVVTIGYYVFTISRVPLQLIGTFYFLAIHTAVSLWLGRGAPMDLITEFVLIGFSNVLGLTAVYRYHVLTRRQYATLLQERQAIRRLETSRYDLIQAKQALEEVHREAVLANRTKSDFLAHMSHELRTPLNAIIGFSEMMNERIFGELPGRYADYAKDINDSGNMLLALINDILDLSKIEAGHRDLDETEVCVANLVDDCLRLLLARARDAGVSVDCKIEHGDVRIYSDERMVKQILINLVINAIKFNRPGGSVTIASELLCDGRFALRVCDTGAGIAEADLPYITEPYWRADVARVRGQEGTGLGLPLVKAMAELHGGGIEVDSEVGEGTSVTVWLPSDRVVASGDGVAG